jgi:hypothetical protein
VNTHKFRALILSAASLGILGIATPTNAAAIRGCNGVVNPLVWGCAPWDNNNGPQFPYHKTTRIEIPRAQAQIVVQNGVQMVKDLRSGQVHPIVAGGAGNIVAGGAGNVIAVGRGN